MTQQASTAYACVAYRIMEYEGNDVSEEYLGILLDTLYGFYTEKEIEKIYQSNLRFDSYTAVIADHRIKKDTDE